MASSGVKPDQAAIDKFQKLKLRKEYGYLLMKVQDDRIIVFDEGKKGASPDDLTKALTKQKDCCFAVYDGHKIGLFAWNPDSAPAKSKMLLASSSEALASALGGIGQAINVSDKDQLVEKLKEKNII